MIRDTFTDRWILGGIVFLIVLSVSCILWYQHVTELYRQETADTAELVREWETENLKTVDIAENVSPQFPTPTQGTTATDTSSVENAESIRMSPYGFGPYPKIPEGAPIADFEEGDSRDMELLTRVMVQKWNDGERFTGGIIENGKVYLTYKHILYLGIR